MRRVGRALPAAFSERVLASSGPFAQSSQMLRSTSAQHDGCSLSDIKFGLQRLGESVAERSKKFRRTSQRLTLRQKLELDGPSLRRLKNLAKTRRPPQRWYAETANPFDNLP
jgi:hypothetical protein